MMALTDTCVCAQLPDIRLLYLLRNPTHRCNLTPIPRVLATRPPKRRDQVLQSLSDCALTIPLVTQIHRKMAAAARAQRIQRDRGFRKTVLNFARARASLQSHFDFSLPTRCVCSYGVSYDCNNVFNAYKAEVRVFEMCCILYDRVCACVS